LNRRIVACREATSNAIVGAAEPPDDEQFSQRVLHEMTTTPRNMTPCFAVGSAQDKKGFGGNAPQL
jgi:hypothetical protein